MNDRQLAYLIHRATVDEQVALARLTELRTLLDESLHQLSVLQEYLEQPGPVGTSIDAGRHARSRRFAAQVDDALRRQRQQVEQIEQTNTDAHECWARLRADRRALERLQDNRRSEAAANQLHREQQQLDEAGQSRWVADRGNSRA